MNTNPMPDEQIDILDNDGVWTGKTALKSEAHRRGWFHRSVHIWFYSAKKEMLLQKRASTKTIFPELWDVSVAGHVGTGETPVTSAVREIKEEIGLEVSPKALMAIGTHKSMKNPSPGIMDNEFHHIYCCPLLGDMDGITLQKEEVEAIKLIPLNVFESQIQTPEFAIAYVPHGLPYYQRIIRTIQDL